jgi:hypothetical protein
MSEKMMTFMMVKVLPLFSRWPLKIFNPLIGKIANWYIARQMAKAAAVAPAPEANAQNQG